MWLAIGSDQNRALEELTDDASDRVIAIVGGALLEDSLRKAIELRFRAKAGKTDMNDALFRPGGPLGTLVPKIQLGFQLYMFEKDYRNSMSGLAAIRNLFAHQLDMHFSSENEVMKAADAKLILHKGLDSYPFPFADDTLSGVLIEGTDTLRGRFLANLKLCLIHLNADQRRHEPNSNNPTNKRKHLLPPVQSPVRSS